MSSSFQERITNIIDEIKISKVNLLNINNIGVKIISVSFGNDIQSNESRYRAAVIFAYNLHKRGIIGPGSADGWTLLVNLKLNSFSNKYKTELESLGCKVFYVNYNEVYMYSIDRYLVHDIPNVHCFISVDSHYVWDDKIIDKFLIETKKWNDSAYPVTGYRTANQFQSERKLMGGWFGIQKLNEKYSSLVMSDLVICFFEQIDEELFVKTMKYGIDEVFITWLINHDSYQCLELKELLNVGSGNLPPDAKYRIAEKNSSYDSMQISNWYNDAVKSITGDETGRCIYL